MYSLKDGVPLLYSALASGGKYLSTLRSNELFNKEDKVAEKKENESPQHVESVSEEEILAAEKAWHKNCNQLPKLKNYKKEVYVFIIMIIQIKSY